ncbi:MAG: DUF2202 domain-containing protein [Deinococcales bacterium]
MIRFPLILLVSTLFLNPLVSCATAQQLSNEETKRLLWITEEEKLASDVYHYLYDIWALKAFSNITASESQHQLAMQELLSRYSLSDPRKDVLGQFSNPDLQQLYDDLIAQGSESLEQALYVGAMIEELDIVDLQKATNLSSREDIRQVYEQLIQGSVNHLQAFMRQIEMRGFSYTPQYLDLESFKSFLVTR